MLAQNPDRVTALQAKAAKFRALLNNLDLKPLPGDSAVVPVIVGETATAIRLAGELLNRGIFVTGFGFPVVPEGEARLRFQISAAHTEAELEEAAIALKDCLQSPGSP